jgi:hypothetical protein
MHVALHPPGALRQSRDRTDHLFTAPAAKSLPRLHRRPASITEHRSPPAASRKVRYLAPNIFGKSSTDRSFYDDLPTIDLPMIDLPIIDTLIPAPSSTDLLSEPRANEKAARQLGGLFFSRENSSNGGKAVKTFWRKSYEPKKRGVKHFLEIKVLYFQ